LSTYNPGNPPSQIDPVAGAYLRREHQAIKNALERADPWKTLEVRGIEPEKVVAGMLVIADGTEWNPGSGEGLYRRNKDNTAWVFIG
jgi:hypothetical protein